ncbi:MAG: (2Fe-2S)-binding protein [Planctomycetota bacterium]|nr:(2Fe-2S)-binding protein [Planctomycetota bacterium]
MAERMQQARDRTVAIEFDGRQLSAHLGETVASVLASAGSHVLRKSARLGEPRGVFCNMGICFECLVYLDGRAVRACMTEVEDGMKLSSWGPKEVDPA